MNKWKTSTLMIIIGFSFFISQPCFAELDADILYLQRRWAEVNYHLDGKTRLTAFETLMGEASLAAARHPDAASIWIWNGIIKSTYSGARGGIRALKLAKASKSDLERALETKADALRGAAYTNLGVLYSKAPRWPIGFGNDKKAERLLLKGITMNPGGIDSNYHYGEYLIGQKRYRTAESYLLRAQAAAERPNRPVADTGRQNEITHALLAIREKLCD